MMKKSIPAEFASKAGRWNRDRVGVLLEGFARCRLLVVGDLMLDRYLWGRVERISPEAPVQVLDVHKETDTLGGAGNVMKNLVSLGGRCSILSVIGEDAAGERVLQLIKHLGGGDNEILVDNSRRTTQKTRIIAENQQILRIDRENREPIAEDVEGRLLLLAEERLEQANGLLISDYGKGVLTPRLIRELIALGRRRSVPVLVDPKGADYEKYSEATLITPNKKEASVASGVEISDRDSLRAAVLALQRKVKDTSILVTLGSEGMALYPVAGGETHIRTSAREVYDVSGAGDTVLSVLGLGLSSGLSLEEAAAVANEAAGIVVAKVGAASTGPAELREALLGRADPYERKIQDTVNLAAELDGLRRQGKRIVFTNGCFDLLHVGHIQFLQESARLGDVLVVALDDDESVRRLKGEGRPILKQEDRLRVLSALDCVDYLCIFSSPDLDALLDQLKPDILTKGGNYTESSILGREVMRRNGGKVAAIPLELEGSISGLIHRIRNGGD
jgi:D-beta-D-heptose 7-phosphate kinase/D-beta-D-heptose 1-phosphate adenosyltransferase